MVEDHGLESDVVVAIVIDFDVGHEGPFVICRVIGEYEGFPNALPVGTSVTFSVGVWKDNPMAGNGTHVLLDNLSRKQAGWRANEARYLRPRDQRAESREQKEKEKA